MVREDEVGAAAMDVDGRAQVAVDHRAALGVPAGAPLAPRGGPARLTGLGGLPEGKVKRIALLVVDLDALAGTQLVQVVTREDAVVVVGAHGEVHVAGGHRVGKALLDEQGDHLLHGLDLTRGARTDVGVHDAEAVHLLDEGGRELLGHIGRGATLVVGAVDDLVVNVREVLGKGDLVALVHEITADDVEGQEGPGVADVDLVVDRGTADVHANLALLDGDKLLLAVRLAVVDEHERLLADGARAGRTACYLRIDRLLSHGFGRGATEGVTACLLPSPLGTAVVQKRHGPGLHALLAPDKA